MSVHEGVGLVRSMTSPLDNSTTMTGLSSDLKLSSLQQRRRYVTAHKNQAQVSIFELKHMAQAGTFVATCNLERITQYSSVTISTDKMAVPVIQIYVPECCGL